MTSYQLDPIDYLKGGRNILKSLVGPGLRFELSISLLVWDATHRRLVVTDVSGQPVGSIFKGKAVQ
jgi:hypothetical protein